MSQKSDTPRRSRRGPEPTSTIRGTSPLGARVEPEYHEAFEAICAALSHDPDKPIPDAQVIRAMIRAAKTRKGFKVLYDSLNSCLHG